MRRVLVAIVVVALLGLVACEKAKQRTPDDAAIAAAIEKARREDAEADRQMRERAAMQEQARRDAEQAVVDDRAAHDDARHAKQLQLEQRLNSILLDPASMQIRNQRLNAAGTALCAEVNGKNKEGAYVGFRRIIVMDNVFSYEKDPDDVNRKPEHQFAAISSLTGCF
jgi:hypothetical protein